MKQIMMSTNTSMEIASPKIKVNHMEDRLSNLPNAIVTKILSYLKTKEAVRTGILSTRWKSVWASVPTLKLSKYDFILKSEDYLDGKAKARFLNFMDRVLLAHKLPSFDKVSLDCSNVDSNIMISWIRAALERNASELDVNFSKCFSELHHVLTRDLFSYNKLVFLKLHVNSTLYFPTASSCFPNLKVLELEDIYYRDDDSLPNLLSSCPILEDLAIIRSRRDEVRTLNITSRSLKRLKVHSIMDFMKPVDVLKVVIDAPAVESLDISCITTNEYVVKDLSSLVEANLNFFDVYSWKTGTNDNYNYIMCLCEFLRGISNAKFLTLKSKTIQSLVLSDSYKLPMFHNLTRLEIYGTCDGNYEWTKYSEWTLILEILKSSPVLEIFILRALPFSPEERGKALEWDVPNCLVSHLKTIEVDYASDDDMEKVRYFLINAKVLEKMIIKSCHSNIHFKLDLCCVLLESARSSSGRETVTWSDTETVIFFV